MTEWFNKYFPNVIDFLPGLIEALKETLIMVGISGLIAALIGIPLGIILVTTRPGHILEKYWVNFILNKIINIFRSIPFIILLAAIVPFTRFVVGTTIGIKGALVPLVIGAIPFIARQIESALLDVDDGVIEAALAMGSSPFEVIYRVIIPEGLPGMIHGLSISIISLIGFSAMAGTVGAGGLGDFAIRYGYQYFKNDIMLVTVIVLLVLVNLIHSISEWLIKLIRH